MPSGQLGLDHLPGESVRESEKADLAASHQIVERAHGFFERREEILVMLPIQIDVVGSEAAQGGLARGRDGFSIGAAAIRVLGMQAFTVLRCDDQPIASSRMGAEALADDLLGAPASILIR